MSGIVQSAVDAMRVDLGLGPMTEPVGTKHVFETEHCEVSIEATPDDARALMVGRLGWLSSDPRSAGDEVQQLLRLGLALAPVNTAAIGPLPEANDFTMKSAGHDRERFADIAVGVGRPMAIAAWADCGAGGKAAGSALRDILQWASLTGDILAREAELLVGTAAQKTVAVDDVLIFRP